MKQSPRSLLPLLHLRTGLSPLCCRGGVAAGSKGYQGPAGPRTGGPSIPPPMVLATELSAPRPPRAHAHPHGHSPPPLPSVLAVPLPPQSRPPPFHVPRLFSQVDNATEVSCRSRRREDRWLTRGPPIRGGGQGLAPLPPAARIMALHESYLSPYAPCVMAVSGLCPPPPLPGLSGPLPTTGQSARAAPRLPRPRHPHGAASTSAACPAPRSCCALAAGPAARSGARIGRADALAQAPPTAWPAHNAPRPPRAPLPHGAASASAARRYPPARPRPGPHRRLCHAASCTRDTGTGTRE